MTNKLPKLLPALLLAAVPAFPQSSWTLTMGFSGGGSPATAPALTTPMFVALALLLAAVAFLGMRRTPSGRLFGAIIAVLGLSVAGAFTGHSLFPAASAAPAPILITTTSGSLSVGVSPNTTYTVQNNSGQTTTITSISIRDNLNAPYSPNAGAGTCQVGTVLAPQATCILRFDAGA